MAGSCSSVTRWTTISPSRSSCHMMSRTSSTCCFVVSIERLSIFSSTQEVATRASSALNFASRHSEPWPVKRSPAFPSLCIVMPVSFGPLGLVLRVFVRGEPIFPVLALLVHDVRDHVEEIFVDGLELLEHPGFRPDGVELDRGLEIHLPCSRRRVERRHGDRLPEELQGRVDFRDVGTPVGEGLG